MDKHESVTLDILVSWTIITLFLRYSGVVDWPWVTVFGPIIFVVVMAILISSLISVD